MGATWLLLYYMLSDAPLARFLSEHPQIQQIKFCMDNDEPGRKAAEALMQKYYELGYDVENKPPPKNYKDYIQWIQEAKKPLQVAGEGALGAIFHRGCGQCRIGMEL